MSAYVIVYRESPVRDPEAVAEYSRRNHANAAVWREAFGISLSSLPATIKRGMALRAKWSAPRRSPAIRRTQ